MVNMSRPAPSEAPNVELAREIQRSRPNGGLAYWMNGVHEIDAQAVASALDSARSEGIAAERERTAQIVIKLTALTEGSEAKSLGIEIAAAIRAGDES